VRVLEDDLHLPPQLPQLVVVEAGDVVAVEADRAARRLDKPQERPAERRLPDSPTSPSTSPRFSSKLTPSTALTEPASRPISRSTKDPRSG
jgi:hypothetical protein